MVKVRRKRSETVQLKIRVKEYLRRLLEHESSRDGTSINAIAVRRLERSFEGMSLLAEASEMAYGAQLALLLDILGREIRHELGRAGTSIDADWFNDATAFDRARAAVMAIFDAVQHAPEAPRREIVGEPGGGSATRFFIGVGDSSFGTMAPWRDRVKAVWGEATIDRITKWLARHRWDNDSTNRRDGVPSP